MTTQSINILTLAIAAFAVVVAVASVIATYKAPINALRVQRELDEAKERSGRKLWIYKTLMSNRATRLNVDFVQALNLIDIEFKEESEKEVRIAWKELLNHYSDWGNRTEQQRKMGDQPQIDRATELLADLLVKMGTSLGFGYDKVDVKKGFYYPEGLMNIEKEQHALRTAMLNLLLGKGAKLPVAIFEQKFGAIAVEPLKDDDKQS